VTGERVRRVIRLPLELLALATLALSVAACGGKEGSAAHGGSRGAAGGAADAGTASPSAVAAENAAVSRDVWNKAEVVRRLEEAGLVVTDSGKKVRNPALKAEGEELGVSGGQLEIYVYPDDAARESDAAGLDTTRKGLPSIYDPKYIISGNMIAILHTPKDRLAERVKLVLTSRHGG
jgi:hypothetical protein